MRVVLNGSEGRMGLSIKKICIEENIEILGVDLKKNDGVYNSFDEINVDFDGIIDFSSPFGMIKAIEFAVKKKKPIVIGTTGYDNIQKEFIIKASKEIPVFISPNMSIGVNLCFYICDIISKIADSDVHIHEIHHKTKKDAPSGTAKLFKDIIEKNGLKSDISWARISDIVGEHTITFGFEGEKIEISHIAYNREIFARGAVNAFKWIVSKKSGLYNFSDMFNMIIKKGE